MQCQHPLEMAYLTYHGHRKPSERRAEFSRVFAAHDFVRLDGPYSDDEVHAYLAGLCHSIWVEENVGLPWSLRDYSPHELRFLLERRVDMNGWNSQHSGHSGCWGMDHPNTSLPREPIADTWYQTYPLSFHLAGRQPDKRQVVLAFVSWIMVNFFHAYTLGTQENWPLSLYSSYGRSGSPDDWLVTLADLFAQRVSGCHGPAKILTALLRSINIPAVEIHYQGHGICYVPTLDLYVHGDFLANFAVLKDNAALLMHLAELERWIFQPKDYT